MTEAIWRDLFSRCRKDPVLKANLRERYYAMLAAERSYNRSCAYIVVPVNY